MHPQSTFQHTRQYHPRSQPNDQRQEYSGQGKPGYPRFKCVSDRITQKHLADKRAKSHRKHGNMQMLSKILFLFYIIQDNPNVAWPYIQEIHSIKTVGNHKQISGQKRSVHLRSTDNCNQPAGKAAYCCIKKCSADASNSKKIRDQRTGRNENLLPSMDKPFHSTAERQSRNRGPHQNNCQSQT